MAKYSPLTRLFLLAIFLANICENYAAYNPPAATVKPLHPLGLRISVPDEQGITLVVFHIKFNEDFDGLEAGHIAKDIIKVRNGQWTYGDRRTHLKRNDIIYYWVHVVYQGLGYNLIDQSHRVVDFYNYDGTQYTGYDPEHSSRGCGIFRFARNVETRRSLPMNTTMSTTWIFENGGQRQAMCPGEIIFHDYFDNLNSANWNFLKRFSGPPDYEFNVYLTNEVLDTSDGQLRIKPILLDTKYGRDFASHGRLILENCTGKVGTEECQRQAAGSYILPPLISGRINTKGKFEFLFGRVEIRAKLPHGDWVYPLITLENDENTWQLGLHREIRVASSVGNEELRTSEGETVSSHILSAGGLTASLNESSVNRMPKRLSSRSWSDDFHIFEIEWKSGLIVVKVDGEQFGEQTVDGSFDKPSYLTLGVAVGGIHEFQDLVTSSDYGKPWRNVEAKALYKFYHAKDHWHPTWDTRTALQIDSVIVWAL